MGKGLLFFCCACCILVLTIVNLSIGPIVSGAVKNININPFQGGFGTLNCEKEKDDWDRAKDGNTKTDDQIKYDEEYEYNACIREKGMHDMEYTAFIFDIVIGFVCGLLGLLHLFDLKKDFVSNTGLIGLICGIIGFALTFVYVIFNGLVYTTVYIESSSYYKRDGDYVFAEKEGDKYKCLYFDDANNGNSKYAKLNDIGKQQYNYEKDALSNVGNCRLDLSSKDSGHDYVEDCAAQETIELISSSSDYAGCEKLYIDHIFSGIENKDLSDRFLTTLILSLIVCLASIGLALFGFLLFRTPGDF